MLTLTESNAIAEAINDMECAYIGCANHMLGSMVWHNAQVKILERTKTLIDLGVNMYLKGFINEKAIS